MASLRISSVSFEHHPTGFGVGHSRPRISWRFESAGDDQGWSQESYDIELRSPGKTEAKIYHADSSQSVLVEWPGGDLKSRESARVRLRAHGTSTDKSGSKTPKSTDWSEQATVEVGLLQKQDWSAKLAASSSHVPKKEPIPPTYFRKTFTLPEKSISISQARLYITAYGVYEASINGQRVGDEEMAPGWTSYKHRLLYQAYDVTASLHLKQANVIGVEVAEGWYAGRLGWGDTRHIFGDRLGFLAQLEVTLDDGNVFVLGSDNSWKSHRSATLRSEIYDGEDYDSREQSSGWNTDTGFDDSSWTNTEELDFPTAKLLASDTPPVRAKERVSPVKIFKSPSGKTLLDFGQNLVGKLEVQLPKTDTEGHSISFSHAEVLEKEELGTRPLRLAKPIDTVFLSGGQPSKWSPKFTFHGFRYVQVDGWPTGDGLPAQDQVTALVLYSDMKRTGHFSCSDEMVNRLHENVIWSMKGNFLSVPTDCPQRDERLGWTGDIQVFSPTANFLYGTEGFMCNWLEDLAAEQLEEGQNSIPGLVVPDVLRGSPLPKDPQAIWHDAAVLTPWDSYQASGDLEILRRQYPSMKAWVDNGIKVGPNGLYDQNIWQLGDWLDPAAPPDQAGLARTDNVLVADAYLVRVLETLTKISALLGETADETRYQERASLVRKAFAHEYITPSGLLAADTQTGHGLALTFQLYNDPQHVQKSASRLDHLVHQGQYRIATGFAGTPLICHALSETGNTQLAYKMLLERACPSWLYPITMGATTIWERWDSMLPDGSINPGQMTSFNHYALGSVANWLHKVVGGISPVAPGWRKFLVKPVPGGTIKNASVAYESPYGRIECAWKINEAGSTFEVDVVVPPNSEAVVVLPGEDQKGGDTAEQGGCVVGSGKHHFSSKYEAPVWPPVPQLKRSIFNF